MFDFLKPKKRHSQPERQPKISISDQTNSDHVWRRFGRPRRKLILWGFDRQNNPGFLVLYGLHLFSSRRRDGVNVLADRVTYTYYTVFRGREGHFPSFEVAKTLVNLKERQRVSFPYFSGLAHKDYVRGVNEKGIRLDNFILAETPGEVLNLPPALKPYERLLCLLFGHPGIYTRKKALRELIGSCTSQELYPYLLNVGSTELIAGLFLELGLQKNDILAGEARQFILSDPHWSGERYIRGVKRCAGLYIDTFDAPAREGRIDFLRSHLSVKDLYEVNKLKNTIQEAEMLGLADVIGKVAYYLDAPELTNTLTGYGHAKGLRYFRRVVRRMMDAWAREDEEKFVEAMKSLFLSYTPTDFLRKFKGNFQFNIFIRHYLYGRFRWQAPTDRRQRWEWMRNDQLMRLEGRHEIWPELWDRHIEAAAEIAAGARIDVIAKAFTNILMDGDNRELLTSRQSVELLIQLCAARYQPLAEAFMGILRDKLEAPFDAALLARLLSCEDAKIQALAPPYAEKILGMEGQTYFRFLHAVMENALADVPSPWPSALTELLEQSLEKAAAFTREERAELFKKAWSVLNGPVSADLRVFLTQILFTPSLDELKSILTLSDFNLDSPMNRSASALLLTIRDHCLPAEGMIRDLLETGPAKMISILIEVITEGRAELPSRPATILLLLESEAEPLNRLAQEAFHSLTGEDWQKMLAMIVDSPAPHVRAYGLDMLEACFKDRSMSIPNQLIVQLLEHPSPAVKSFISDKLLKIIDDPQHLDPDLFLYYAKTLLLLPNRISAAKSRIYDVLPVFTRLYAAHRKAVEDMLLELGGANIIRDSERALVALARIRKEAV